VAESMILAPSGLDEQRLATVLGTVMSRGVDYADLYFQLSREESWALEDGMVKEGSHSIEQGVGVRAISGEKTGFAYTDEVLLPALVEASDAARAIARSGANHTVKAWQRPLTHRLYLPIDPLDTIREEDKVAWLMKIDAAAHHRPENRGQALLVETRRRQDHAFGHIEERSRTHADTAAAWLTPRRRLSRAGNR
jgi:TldD protein